MPLAVDVLVVVDETALTVTPDAAVVMLSVCDEPDPEREKFRPLAPSAVWSCVARSGEVEEKFAPTRSGLAPAAFCSGSAFGSVTLTIETWCCVPDVSV